MTATVIRILESPARQQFPKTNGQWSSFKKCVAVLTMLYKKSGAVSGVGSNFLSDWALYHAQNLQLACPTLRKKREPK